MTKEKYEQIDIEVVRFEDSDVIATSTPVNPDCNWLSEIVCEKVE